MLIDTHCHLNFHAFTKDLDDVVRRAKEKGVEKIIVPGTDLSSSRRAVEIAQKYPEVCYAAIGIHPHHAQEPNFIIDDNVRRQLGELLLKKGVVAVGEVGLDYYHYTKTKYKDTEITNEIKQKQKELLTLQLELALIHNKPVILHCREAHDEMIQVIRQLMDNVVMKRRSSKTRGWKPLVRGKSDLWQTISRNFTVKTNYIKRTHLSGVWHCFGGNAKQLQDIIAMGYYVGFDGNITYNEIQYSPLVSLTPLNRILLETDSPFLTPVPHRGTRNEPGYLPFIAQTIAKYHSSPLSVGASTKVGFSEVIHISTRNALDLFNLR